MFVLTFTARRRLANEPTNNVLFDKNHSYRSSFALTITPQSTKGLGRSLVKGTCISKLDAHADDKDHRIKELTANFTYNILIFTKVFKTRQVYLKLLSIEKFTLLECHIQQ